MSALLTSVVIVAAPGVALLLALGVTRPVSLVGVSIPASMGVATMTASFCAVVGVDYGPVPYGLVTALLLGVAAVRGVRARRTGASEDDSDPDLQPPTSAEGALQARVALLPGVLLALLGVAVCTAIWMRGMGSLDTILQEHDMISHGVITSYIERTGRGAPWQVMPADVLTGDGVSFYPNGMHLLMAVVAGVQDDAVVGVNAVTVVTLAIGWTSGSACLGYVAARRARLEPTQAILVAGLASLVAAGLYRPAIALVQWGGILANAVTLSLTPGLLAGLLSLRRRGWSHAVAVGVGVAGLFAVHSTAAITVCVALAAWWLGDVLTADGRSRFREQLVPLVVAGAAACVFAAPAAGSALGAAGDVSGFAPDIVGIGFGDALKRTLGHAHNGGDPQVALGDYQLAAAGLCVFGAAMVAATRRGLGALSAWLVWVVIVVAAWVRPGGFPQSLITNAFYDAQTRIWSHVSLFVPPLAGLGVVLAASIASGWIAARRPAWRERMIWAVPGLVLVVALVYTALPGRSYARGDTNAVASRYDKPDVTQRFSAADRAAGDWLASRVRDGERVLNSGNDGSTLLYVDNGLPIVNVSARGSAKEPATYRLMKSFNTYPDDPEIRRMLRELNVRWVVVDAQAPTIAANGAPEAWITWLGVPPGLKGLGSGRQFPGLERVFRDGTVSVYELDRDAIES